MAEGTQGRVNRGRQAGRRAREEPGGPELGDRQGHLVKAEGAWGLGWVGPL